MVYKFRRDELRAIAILIQRSRPMECIVLCGADAKPICTGCGHSAGPGKPLSIRHSPDCGYKLYWDARKKIDGIWLTIHDLLLKKRQKNKPQKTAGRMKR